MRRFESFAIDRRSVLGPLLAAVFFAASSSEAHACSCRPFTLDSRFETSANVFTAVITAEYVEPSDEAAPVRSLFRVTERFKGGPPFGVFVSNPQDGCGIDLEEGSEYLFFVPDSGEIHYCLGISEIEYAEPDVAQLRSYVLDESSSLSEPWRFSVMASGECSLRTFFEFGNDFGQGSLMVRASNERADWARDEAHFDFVELALHLMHRSPLEIDAPSPLRLKVGSAEYAAVWTTGRTFEQFPPDGSTVQARLPDSYLLLGDDVERLLRDLAVSDELLVRFDGQGFEPNREVAVRAANMADVGPEMLECMEALRSQ